MAFRSLQSERVVETVAALQGRISDRFPGSGLSKIAAELHQVAREAMVRSAKIRRPNYFLRGFATLLAAAIIGLLAWTIYHLRFKVDFRDLTEFIGFLNDALGSMVFIGAAILFLVTMDSRTKRGRALKAMHELRALAHIIDMHQLTKDPERLLLAGPDTASSPKRMLTPFELGRYLAYCSEMYAIVSKIAALYVQEFHDAVALEAVDQVEDLTTGLSRKVWQKISVLDQAVDQNALADDSRGKPGPSSSTNKPMRESSPATGTVSAPAARP